MTLDQLTTVAELLGMLSAVGALVLLIIRMRYNTTYRLALGIALLAAFLILWINLAVGIIGEPENPANLMYFGVITVGIVGALIGRFQPDRMTRALFATAIAQALVASITAFAALGEPVTWWWSLLFLNGVFIALWVGSACLFRKAARVPPPGDAGPDN